jgi:hypothetical protein
MTLKVFRTVLLFSSVGLFIFLLLKNVIVQKMDVENGLDVVCYFSVGSDL